MKHLIATTLLVVAVGTANLLRAATDSPAVPAPRGSALQAAKQRLDAEPESTSTAPGSAARRSQQRALPGSSAGRAASESATIHGSVFYNDRRTDGLFALRRDKTGNPGQRCNGAGKRDDGSPCSLNWLAGKYMVVDVVERDEGFLPTDLNCKKEEIIASATVAYDGSYSVTFSTDDPCKHDKRKNAAIELRVRLRFCNASYCFSINREKDDPYAVVHPGATASDPLTVRAGDDVGMTTLNFSTASDPAKPNDYAIAANYYASIVDTVLALHKDSPIPFYTEEFGEIQYIFPSTKSGTATTRSPSEVAVSTFQSKPTSANGAFAWVDGKTPAHEYGHVMMLRAWGGEYGFDGIGISAGSSAIAPSRQIAFKEGWAEFIARAVFEPTRGCNRASYDDNGDSTTCVAITQALAQLETQRRQQIAILDKLQGAGLEAAREQLERIEAQIAAKEDELEQCQSANTTTDLPGALGEGAQWRDNVTKALCDWYEDRDDDDPRLAGPGDYFAAEDIYSMWYNLRRMYLDAKLYGGQFDNPGLWFCDYVDYYLTVRKSTAEVGAALHSSYQTKIRDLIYNNNIGCSMAAPPG